MSNAIRCIKRIELRRTACRRMVNWGISASTGGVSDIESAVFDNGEWLIRRYINAKLGIAMASRAEMEGTDVSRLHDLSCIQSEFYNVAEGKRNPCVSSACKEKSATDRQKRGLKANWTEIWTRHAQKRSSPAAAGNLKRFRRKLNIMKAWQNCGRTWIWMKASLAFLIISKKTSVTNIGR